MTAERQITFADLQRAARIRDPELAELVIAYVEQPDPPEGEPEEKPAEDDAAPGAATAPKTIPEDAWTMSRLQRATATWALARKNATERKAARREAWDALSASPAAPPRIFLGNLLLELYEAGDEPAKSALVEIISSARIVFGLWRGLKKIYKLAELKHDAAIFGAFAFRFDALAKRGAGEISQGTFIYLRRRAWRWLRNLGRAVPELYPQFAAEVLKHYPRDFDFRGAWIANQIWAHKTLIGHGRPTGISGPPNDLSKRAFDAAWKISPDPLLGLLEDAEHDSVAHFAIAGLTKDHPEALRRADPRWIARLGAKPLGAVHEFLTKLLEDTPELHPTKLRALGLHDTVLSLLGSPSAAARKYALEYARAHAADMPIADLVRWVSSGTGEVKTWAAAKLAEKTAKELGIEVLVRLLELRDTSAMASARIKESFGPRDITQEIFVSLALAGDSQRKVLAELYTAAKEKPPAAHWEAVLDDERCDYRAREAATEALSSYSGKELGPAWLAKALFDPRHGDWVAEMLEGGALKGDDLDVEWVKSLVLRPRFRQLALSILGEPSFVAPARVGLTWLLAMSRQADETLSGFAHRYLLEHFAPEDFDPGPGRSLEKGVDRLWSLATGPGEPEVVRLFAAEYLEIHHPDIHATKPEARSLGIQARLTHDAYPAARVRPLFLDERADVRKLAASIARQELVRWGDNSLLYALADNPHRESRGAAADLFLAIGETDADPARTPPLEWLEPGPVFALAESVQKSTRELALAMIRRHYARLGGAGRLAWLMESPDREVRLFAVRLLWEKHRPRPGVAGESFDTSGQLTHFLRSTLFGLPPGRMERRELTRADDLPKRPLPASIAKRRLVEVVRDLAKEDVDFAYIAVPVLEEFSRSTAKGEWQSCIAALATIAAAHPSLEIRIGSAVAPAAGRAR